MREEAVAVEQLAWVRWVEHHDEPALAELIVMHRPMVTGVCRRILGAGLDADEVADEVFADLAAEAVGIRGPVAAWLRACARYRACRRSRMQRPDICLDPEGVAVEPGLATTVEDRIRLRERMALVLDSLTSGERKALEQRFFQNHSPAEIARTVGVSPQVVRRRIGSALGRLRRLSAMRQLYAETW